MENRVYYGEYSLQHWIELILKGNVILPEYQRHFVWSETKVETLVETFRKRQFVPPVTIGAFKNGGVNQNLILDGQQRLTSILLAYLGLYPDETTYKKAIEKLADENDDSDEENEELDNVLEWTFKSLLKRGKNKRDILANVTPGNYKPLQIDLDDAFLKNNFLGFSYLVPYITDEIEQQKYYSSVFRNINVQGVVLLPQESRASLYFLDKNLVQYFAPNFFTALSIKTLGAETKADFVRYLALLAQYKRDGNANRIARGYKPQMEKYYEQYIYSVVGENQSSLFEEFSSIFPDKDYKPRFDRLAHSITTLDIPTQFSSIIDLDLYVFGLIYAIVFEGRKIDDAQKEDLKTELEVKIEEFKSDYSHTKAPAALKYLKARINASVEIYERYAS